MTTPPNTTSQKTSFIPLALASACSALLVVGAHEIRARLSKGHPASRRRLRSQKGKTPRRPKAPGRELVPARAAML
jgi:hypothetical protein